jgi:hypothetical protein
MSYRGPGFLAGSMIRLLAHLLPPSPISNLSLFLSLPVCRRQKAGPETHRKTEKERHVADGRGGGGGWG